MKLSRLLENLTEKEIIGNPDVEIEKITSDSRCVEKGSLFVCVKGSRFDGHGFSDEAKRKGAVAIVAERKPEGLSGITLVLVSNTRKALAKLACEFYENPSHSLKLVGITGTNGKTSTAFLTRSILEREGESPALLGTVSYIIKDRTFEGTNTTPDSLELQRLLSEIKNVGIRYVVMEVSSHALELHRIEGCYFSCAVFTNLTQDHLDFHKDMNAYLSAKLKLFSGLHSNSKGTPRAVVNLDDPRASAVISAVTVPVVTYGISSDAEIVARKVHLDTEGSSFELVLPSGKIEVRLSLLGLHNVYNALASASASFSMGIAPEFIKEGLEKLLTVPGRFQKVPNKLGLNIAVDYAHTPDALLRTLRTAKELWGETKNGAKVICVFGCGGDRDKDKRPKMGKIAGELCDFFVITSDNPRGEDLLSICSEIEKGVKTTKAKKGGNYEVIVDRKPAIERALKEAKKQDIIIIAGKGHESYQILKDKIIPFNDVEVIKEVLEK